MKTYLQLLRVPQWSKNSFVFLALFFSGRIFETDLLATTGLAALCFCLTASSIYILNDYLDAQNDRQHPEKCKRPIASGAICPGTAIVTGMLCGLIGIGVADLVHPGLAYWMAGYAAFNVAYSIKLKNIPIVDINCIAVGFLIRVIAGGWVAGIPVSEWLVLLTYFLSLFLALAKRRDDLLIEARTNTRMRQATHGYNITFVNIAMSVTLTVMIVGYLMYVESAARERYNVEMFYLSVIPVVTGVMRYLQIALVTEKSGSPTDVLLRDRPLQAVIASWVLFMGVGLYNPL